MHRNDYSRGVITALRINRAKSFRKKKKLEK